MTEIQPYREGNQEETMTNVIEKLEKEQLRLDIPRFDSGDTVKVHVKIREGEKERIQVFQGVRFSICPTA